MLKLSRSIVSASLAVPLLMLCTATPVDAQGQGNGPPRTPPGQAKKTEGTGGTNTTYDPFPAPSPWRGIGDVEAGNTNTQDELRVMRAVSHIKSGKKYRLGHEYTATMPLFPGNSHQLTVGASVPMGSQVGNSESYAGHINQNGTQFDALGHFGYLPAGAASTDDALYYDQRFGREVWGADGLRQLGVEKMKPLFTRGILIDVARYTNNNQTLPAGTEITLDMVRATLTAQGLTESDIEEGDVLLFRTGWEANWTAGSAVYYAGAFGNPGATPGIGLPVAQWAASKRVACVGSDNWGVEVVPNPNAPAGISFPVHHELLVKNGIPHQESMHLQELSEVLAADFLQAKGTSEASGIYKFAYIFVPVPMKGGSGSPGAPLAVR